MERSTSSPMKGHTSFLTVPLTANTLADLPRDTLLVIFGYLSAISLGKLSRVNKLFHKLIEDDELIWKPRVVARFNRLLNYDETKMPLPSSWSRGDKPKDWSEDVSPQQLKDINLPKGFPSWKTLWVDLEYHPCWRCNNATLGELHPKLRVKFCPPCYQRRKYEGDQQWGDASRVSWKNISEIYALTPQDFKLPKKELDQMERWGFPINTVEILAANIHGTLYNLRNPKKLQAYHEEIKRVQKCKKALQRLLTPSNIHLNDHIVEKSLQSAQKVTATPKRTKRAEPIISYPPPDNIVPVMQDELADLKDLVEGHIKSGLDVEKIAEVIIANFESLRENYLVSQLKTHGFDTSIVETDQDCIDFVKKGPMSPQEKGAKIFVSDIIIKQYQQQRQNRLLAELKKHKIEDFDVRSFPYGQDYLEGEMGLPDDLRHTESELVQLIICESKLRQAKENYMRGVMNYFHVPTEMEDSNTFKTYVNEFEPLADKMDAMIQQYKRNKNKKKKNQQSDDEDEAEEPQQKAVFADPEPNKRKRKVKSKEEENAEEPKEVESKQKEEEENENNKKAAKKPTRKKRKN